MMKALSWNKIMLAIILLIIPAYKPTCLFNKLLFILPFKFFKKSQPYYPTFKNSNFDFKYDNQAKL